MSLQALREEQEYAVEALHLLSYFCWVLFPPHPAQREKKIVNYLVFREMHFPFCTNLFSPTGQLILRNQNAFAPDPSAMGHTQGISQKTFPFVNEEVIKSYPGADSSERTTKNVLYIQVRYSSFCKRKFLAKKASIERAV